jgi:uncharacterized DUF497 family protein
MVWDSGRKDTIHPVVWPSCNAYTIEVRCSTGTHTICARFGRHRIKAGEVEDALSNSPIPIYEQDVEGEVRYVYYGETDSGRLLAVVLVERGLEIRVVTAYDLDAGQKKDYLARRLRGE